MVTPSLLSGFDEYLPDEQMLFNHLFDTIRHSYEHFGFLPIETPAIEKAEILLAKGGGETEKQMYRWTHGKSEQSEGYEVALHFDLTVPLARYVAQHFHELTFPFKRFQMQKVWRAERAQKGRAREFYQCDADILDTGPVNLLNDAELVGVIVRTFEAMGTPPVIVKINNRKILQGFFASLGLEKQNTEVLRIIDKLDKIGTEGVLKELNLLGVTAKDLEKIMDFISLKGSPEEVFLAVKKLTCANEIFLQGLKELEEVIGYIQMAQIPEDSYMVDFTIARGLDYYTGTVYETNLKDYPGLGSVCSGGRFDQLVSHYSKQEIHGVGVSIGLTRLFAQLRETGILNDRKKGSADVLIANIQNTALSERLSLATQLRASGVRVDVYSGHHKLGKQFEYAENLHIKKVVILGEDEAARGVVKVRDMESKNEVERGITDIVKML